VQRKLLLKLTFIPLGIALLFAGLFVNEGSAQSSQLQGTAVPTPDRLAEPTLPPTPSQADHGAQVYWLSCLPCHGDQGQGLTDEFRTTYPPEEQYCWESGCHGANPYESGFTIPKVIPAVIGETALSKFTDAAQLNAYIRATMPFWSPGSLAEDEAWKVTAFILRENDLWDDRVELNVTNAGQTEIPRGLPIPVAAPQQSEAQEGSEAVSPIILIGSLFIVLIMAFIFKKSKNTTTI
jgi:cytochrome c